MNIQSSSPNGINNGFEFINGKFTLYKLHFFDEHLNVLFFFEFSNKILLQDGQTNILFDLTSNSFIE